MTAALPLTPAEVDDIEVLVAASASPGLDSIGMRLIATIRQQAEQIARLEGALQEIAEYPGYNADEAAHWRADMARAALNPSPEKT